MGRLKSTVGVKARVVEYNVESAVAQRAAGRVEIEFGDSVGHPVDGLAILRVEPQRVVAKRVGCGLELLEYVLVVEEIIVSHAVR